MITNINEYKIYLLNEKTDNIYQINGTLFLNKDISPIEDIYSKIRSLKGVTIVTPNEIIDKEYQDKFNYKIDLSIKIDKYPYLNNDDDGFNVENFIHLIKNINGVNTFINK